MLTNDAKNGKFSDKDRSLISFGLQYASTNWVEIGHATAVWHAKYMDSSASLTS